MDVLESFLKLERGILIITEQFWHYKIQQILILVMRICLLGEDIQKVYYLIL